MTTTATPDTVLEAVEAQARVEMARVAKLPARGWDTERKRAEVIADIDVLLDQYNGLRG